MKKNKNKATEGKSLQVIKNPNTAVLKKKKKGKNKKTLQINGNVNELMALSSPIDASTIPKKNKKNKKGKKNIAKNEVKPVTDAFTENEDTPMAEESSANKHTNPKKKKKNKNTFLAQKMSGTAEAEESSTNGIVSLKKRKRIENELVSQEDSGKSDVAVEDKPNLPESDGKKKKKRKKKTLDERSPSAPDPSTTVSVAGECSTDSTKESSPGNLDEAGRTLFVGNVNANAKVRDLKRLFSKYGKIETVRFRCAAVNDPKQSKKEAVITRNLHPSRSTLSAFVRFTDSSTMEAALEANGVEFLGKHLRVDKSVQSTERNIKHSVFVGNLSFGVEEEDLYEHFAGCGEIESVRVVRDRKLMSGKGFGYVNFMSKDSVEIALRLSGQLFMNRQLRVQRCLGKTKVDRQAKKKAKKVEKKVIKTKKENISQKDADFSEEENMEDKKFKKAKNNLKTKKLGVVSKKKGLAFMKPIKTNSTKRERKNDDFSGVKMMETKKFKKMKKKGKFTNEDKKKFAIARQLTGVKPRAKKAA